MCLCLSCSSVLQVATRLSRALRRAVLRCHLVVVPASVALPAALEQSIRHHLFSLLRRFRCSRLRLPRSHIRRLAPSCLVVCHLYHFPHKQLLFRSSRLQAHLVVSLSCPRLPQCNSCRLFSIPREVPCGRFLLDAALQAFRLCNRDAKHFIRDAKHFIRDEVCVSVFLRQALRNIRMLDSIHCRIADSSPNRETMAAIE